MDQYENDNEIQILREYLRIPSVHPNINYEPCVEFLKRQAADLSLPVNVFTPAKRIKPVVVITWIGQEPELPAIMLNSHMDVAPVFIAKWTFPPFAADIDNDDRIFGRGIQDAKSTGMQYLAAIRALIRDGVQAKRTTHITFVPDEDIGGRDGMQAFVRTNAFKRLNIGFALDEGVASPINVYPVFYAERAIYQTVFLINGSVGDPSLLHKKTAGEKFNYLFTKLMCYREQQVKVVCENRDLLVGDVTTINLTKVESGSKSGDLPSVIEASFDIRLAVNVDLDRFEQQINQWCEEAGGDIEVLVIDQDPCTKKTSLDDSNPFWMALKRTCDEENLKLAPLICPGNTDMRFLRQINIPALGFAPMPNTPMLSHDHDEYLHADTYLCGIELYKKIIPALLNV